MKSWEWLEYVAKDNIISNWVDNNGDPLPTLQQKVNNM